MSGFNPEELASDQFTNFADALIYLRHAPEADRQHLEAAQLTRLLRILHPHDAGFADLDAAAQRVLDVLTRHDQTLREAGAPVDGVRAYTAGWLEDRLDGSGFAKVMGSLEMAAYTDVQELRDRVIRLNGDDGEILADYAFLLKSIEGLGQDVYWVLREEGGRLLAAIEAVIHDLPGTGQDLVLHALEAHAGTEEGRAFFERFIEQTGEKWLEAAAGTYLSRG